jgi:zinc protease
MLRTIFVATLLIFLASLLPAQSIFPYKYEETTLENGLKVILIPMKNTGLVSYYTIVRTGSRDEVEPGKTGFAHFFEHMMFRGTEKYPAEKWNEITMEMGADSNASTSDDMTVYYLHFPSRYIEKVIELHADKFMNTVYPLEAFQTEAKAILGE